jgi:cell division protein FtsW
MRFYPRLLELFLLLVAFAVTGSAFYSVYQALRPPAPIEQEAWLIATPMAAFLVAHWVISYTQPRANQALLPIAATLTGVGLTYLYRVDAALGGSRHMSSQSATVMLGMAGLVVMASIGDVRQLARYKYLCMTAGLALLLLTAALGDEVHGKALKITVGSFEFQPTELVKLLLVVFVAAYLAERGRLMSQRWGRWVISGEDIRYIGPILVMWLASQALLFWQKDLGAALLFFGIFLAMISISNARALYQAIGWLMLGAGAYVASLYPRTRTRFEIWLHPWAFRHDQAFQIVQGLYALGFGGLWGTGWGRGAPQYIPAVQTDFVMIGLAGEIGLVGAIGILALYLALVWQGFGIALRARNSFSSLLAAGLTLVMVIQVLVIVGGCLLIIPLTGVPVPFLSRGGTNMVCNLALVGLLLAISAERERAGGSGDGEQPAPGASSARPPTALEAE